MRLLIDLLAIKDLTGVQFFGISLCPQLFDDVKQNMISLLFLPSFCTPEELEILTVTVFVFLFLSFSLSHFFFLCEIDFFSILIFAYFKSTPLPNPSIRFFPLCNTHRSLNQMPVSWSAMIFYQCYQLSGIYIDGSVCLVFL